jgi:hypothetical protein
MARGLPSNNKWQCTGCNDGMHNDPCVLTMREKIVVNPKRCPFFSTGRKEADWKPFKEKKNVKL